MVSSYPLAVDDVRRRLPTRPGHVLDIGPGIQPQTIVEAKHSWCLEPCADYAEVLEERGHRVIRATWQEGLESPDLPEMFDVAFALDVIEHLEESEGAAALKATAKRAKVVVVFTPLGFFEQTCKYGRDPWGYSGDSWQTHRSGWTPKSLEATLPGRWDFVTIKRGIRQRWDPETMKHVQMPREEWRHSFFGVWKR